MKNKIFATILILTVILFSGCTMPDTLPVGDKYCAEIGLCEKDVKEEVEIPDIITIKEIKFLTISGERVSPNTTVDVMVKLKNRDENKPVNLEDVRINPGIFSCGCDRCNCNDSYEMNPGQIKSFTFTIKSPDNEGTIAMEGQVSASVKYEYTSSRKATITFTKKRTVVEYIEGGKKIPIHISNVPSDGPVDLYLDISQIQQPVILDNPGPYNMYLEVRNKGAGEVDKIEADDLNLTMENMGFVDCSEEFGGESCSGDRVKNNKKITVRGPNPSKYYFAIDTSKVSVPSNQLTVVKTITAKSTYTYRISKSRNLLVSPRAQI